MLDIFLSVKMRIKAKLIKTATTSYQLKNQY